MHLVLLGDSVFDNQAYVPASRAVIDHVRAGIGGSDAVTLLAVDGELSRDVLGQLDRLPADVTHLGISVGGNDALECLPTLERPVGGVMEALMHLSQIQANFARDYIQTMEAVSKLNLPTTVCTIYDDVPGLSAPLRTALSLFNDVIVRTAMRHDFNVLDLREWLTETADFSLKSPIEPSDIGGMKIAKGLLSAYLSGVR